MRKYVIESSLSLVLLALLVVYFVVRAYIQDNCSVATGIAQGMAALGGTQFHHHVVVCALP